MCYPPHLVVELVSLDSILVLMALYSHTLRRMLSHGLEEDAIAVQLLMRKCERKKKDIKFI